MMDDSRVLDNSALLEEYVEKQGPMKKRVVPNSNQDKWLFYLLTNLNKANARWTAAASAAQPCCRHPPLPPPVRGEGVHNDETGQ